MARTIALFGPHTSRTGSRTLLSRALALLALRRSRRQLAQLDAYRLRDIGLTPESAKREANAPIWDAPAHWLR